MQGLFVNVVGAGAALCSMTSFTPQLVKIWRDRDAEQVSLRMYVVTVAGFTLWTAYGALLGSWPLIASNMVSLGLSAAILALTLRFRHAAKQKGRRTSPAAPPFG